MKSNGSVIYKYAIVLNKIQNSKLITAIDFLVNLKDEKITNFFSDPTISPREKSDVISDVFKLDARSKNFIEIVFRHKRFKILRNIKEMAEKISMREKGLERVLVRSAIPLNESDEKIIKDAIKSVRKIEPLLIVKVDPTLLAGIVIDFEDSIIDLSASGMLKKAVSFISGG